MASKRQIKKAIQNACGDIAGECIFAESAFGEDKIEQWDSIIIDTALLQQEVHIGQEKTDIVNCWYPFIGIHRSLQVFLDIVTRAVLLFSVNAADVGSDNAQADEDTSAHKPDGEHQRCPTLHTTTLAQSHNHIDKNA